MNTKSFDLEPPADRSIAAKIERLRRRVKQSGLDPKAVSLFLGMLDLLEDEL